MQSNKISVVTSFSKQGYELYGRKFLETFQQYWPNEVELFIYHEGMKLESPTGAFINLISEVPHFTAFIEQFGDIPEFQGKKPLPNHNWKQKDIEAGYSFRWDAVKFCRKIFAIEDAASRIKTGKLFWVDADVVTFDHIPLKWLKKLIPNDYAICYLGRVDTYHSECGFVGYNLDDPNTLLFINAFAELYLSGTFQTLREFHDSYVFDCLRKKMQINAYNLTPNGIDRGHVWLYSELAKYMDHLKGDNKYLGKSPIHLGLTKREERYWSGRN